MYNFIDVQYIIGYFVRSGIAGSVYAVSMGDFGGCYQLALPSQIVPIYTFLSSAISIALPTSIHFQAWIFASLMHEEQYLSTVLICILIMSEIS